MENSYVYVCIEWFNRNISNPEVPPEGIRFCPQIRFEMEGNIMPKWTAEVIIRRWGNNSSCYAELRYLFNGAPEYLLKRGEAFILFDGTNEIAKGKVVSYI